MKGSAALAAEPQADPVLEIAPVAEKVAHPAVPPPALETVRFVVEAEPDTSSCTVGVIPIPTRPFLSIRSTVEVAEAVELEMVNSGV